MKNFDIKTRSFEEEIKIYDTDNCFSKFKVERIEVPSHLKTDFDDISYHISIEEFDGTFAEAEFSEYGIKKIIIELLKILTD